LNTLIHCRHITIIYQAGAQCIHLAAKSGNLATLELIISYGADTNARTDPQLFQSPLHFAASNPTHAACQMLLSHGADLMAQDAVLLLNFLLQMSYFLNMNIKSHLFHFPIPATF
jgi:ankyrin repeat protein